MNDEIIWNRKDIEVIWKNKQVKPRARYPAKARALFRNYDKFEGLSIVEIEHLLRCMSSNERQEEWVYNMNRKRSYNDCTVSNYTEDQLRLKDIERQYVALQQEHEQLVNEYEEIYKKFNSIYSKFVKLNKEYKNT